MACDEGFVEYPSLPGRIITGCVNSPAYKSRFCTQHSPRSSVSKPRKQSVSDVHNALDSTETSEKPPFETGESIIKMILKKRETRGGIYYKV